MKPPNKPKPPDKPKPPEPPNNDAAIAALLEIIHELLDIIHECCCKPQQDKAQSAKLKLEKIEEKIRRK